MAYPSMLIAFTFKILGIYSAVIVNMNTLKQEHVVPIDRHSLPVVLDGIIYDVLDDQCATQAIHCLTTTFPANEPMTKHLGISGETFHDFAELFVQKAIVDGLSMAAIDMLTGKLLGCLISEDSEGNPPEGLEHIHADFDPIFALLDKLNSFYTSTHLSYRNGLLHEFMMGVHSECKGRNIGSNLIMASHTLGRMQGFKGAIAEVTGPISQRIFIDKHHYQVLEEMKYCEFEYKGNPCFENIPDGATCKLVYKDFH